MIWPDWKIEQAAEAEKLPLIQPQEPTAIASYDLVEQICSLKLQIRMSCSLSVSRIDERAPVLARARHFVLAETEEMLSLPSHVVGER